MQQLRADDDNHDKTDNHRPSEQDTKRASHRQRSPPPGRRVPGPDREGSSRGRDNTAINHRPSFRHPISQKDEKKANSSRRSPPPSSHRRAAQPEYQDSKRTRPLGARINSR